MNDLDTDPVVPRLDTSGTREPRRGEQPRTLGGTVATVVVLLGALFAVAASPSTLVGFALALLVGGCAVAITRRRHSARAATICLPRTSVCVRI